MAVPVNGAFDIRADHASPAGVIWTPTTETSMTEKTETISVSTQEGTQHTVVPETGARGALADAALLLLGAFIVIFVISAVVALIGSRKTPKK